MSNETAGSDSTESAPDAKPAESKSVLVVDDEEIVREILNEVLQVVKIPSIIAKNGEEGIELYTKNRDMIEIVLLDLVMPGISGIETYRKILEIDPEAKIIFMSGYPDKEVLTMTDVPDNYLFIKKPFSVQDVISSIQQMMT